MKKLGFVFLTLAVCLLLGVTGYAAELEEDEAGPAEEVGAELQTITQWELPGQINEETGFPDSVSLFETLEWPEGGTRYRDQLSEWGKGMYDFMEEAFKQGKEQYIDVNYTSGTQFCAVYQKELGRVSRYDRDMNAQIDEYRKQYSPELNLIWLAFTYDHPEFFWIRYNGGGNIVLEEVGGKGQEAYAVLAQFSYVIDKSLYSTSEQRESLKRSIDNVIKSILAGCEGESTVVKLAYFDNWLAANNAYNSTAASNGIKTIGPIPWNATSALLSNYSPVCEGYAKAFQLLCHEIGVPCIAVSSSNHMWNMVQVDGQWYHMDCTWNDPIVGNGGSRNYSSREYFLLANIQGNTGGGGIGGSHTIQQTLAYPDTAESDYDYSPSDTDWAISNNRISGSRTSPSNGKYWMALYDNNRKLLGLLPCVIDSWKDKQIIVAPKFSSSIVSQAQYGKVFVVGNGTSWKPEKEAEEFFRMAA